LIRFFGLFNAKTGYGRSDTAISLHNSLGFEQELESEILKCVGVYSAKPGAELESKISDSVHLCRRWSWMDQRWVRIRSRLRKDSVFFFRNRCQAKFLTCKIS